MGRSYGVRLVGRSLDWDEYSEIMWKHHGVDTLLIAPALLELNGVRRQRRPDLFPDDADELMDEQLNHLIINAHYDLEERNPKYWHRPEDFAQAARALARSFRRRSLLARHLWAQTEEEVPQDAEDLPHWISNDGLPLAPDDWGGFLAEHLERLADAALHIGKLGEERLRVDFTG